MRHRMACLAGVLVIVTAAIAHADIGDYLGKPVASVRLTIEGRETRDPVLLPFVETQLGRPLSMVDVRESVVHLYSSGRFEDVRVLADAAPAAGVALHYELVPLHLVERIAAFRIAQRPRRRRGPAAERRGRALRGVAPRWDARPTSRGCSRNSCGSAATSAPR